MKTKNKVVRFLKTALIIFTVLTVLFIWINSCIPKKPSTIQSDNTKKVVEQVSVNGVEVFKYIANNIRKSAHVFEYALFGTELSAGILIFVKKLRIQHIWNVFSLALAVSVSDESIQILSGRGPLITDVLLDMTATVSAMLLVFGVYALVRIIKRQKMRVLRAAN